MVDTQVCPIASMHIHTCAHAYAHYIHILRRSQEPGRIMYDIYMVSSFANAIIIPILQLGSFPMLQDTDPNAWGKDGSWTQL